MEWFKDYWWIILILLVGVFLNAIKDLNKLSYKKYLDKKNGIKPIPYDDDEDDWPKKPTPSSDDANDKNKK